MFSRDIASKLKNRKPFVVPPANYLMTAMARHSVREIMVRTQQNNFLCAYNAQKMALKAQIAATLMDLDLPMALAKISNDIATVEFELAQPVEVQMTKQECTEYRGDSKAHTDCLNKLIQHWGQVFSLILGQCTQLLQDNMKQEILWTTVSNSDDPLQLYSLIEKIILKQMDDQYPFATVHEQELTIFSTKQGS